MTRSSPDYIDVRAGYRALSCPRYELVPVRGVIEQAGLLPRGATVTVTCSPRLGLDRTLETAETLHGMGFVAVPHIAARLVRDRRHLVRLLDRLADRGLQEVFVVGGDLPRPAGEFASGRQLLAAMEGMPARPATVGVPGYPEGHALIDRETLDDSLRLKTGHADYLVTQLCFDPALILGWLRGIRSRGIRLPAYIGIPGVVDRGRLLSIAFRLGLGDSTRMLRRNGSLIGQLFQSGSYSPDELVRAILPEIGRIEAEIAGFHVNTFNNVEPTVRWKLALLEELRHRQPSAADPPLSASVP